MGASDYSIGPIEVEGFAIDDFLLTDKLPPDKAPATIEIDRLNMTARPGFNRKLLPLRVEQDSTTVYSGSGSPLRPRLGHRGRVQRRPGLRRRYSPGSVLW